MWCLHPLVANKGATFVCKAISVGVYWEATANGACRIVACFCVHPHSNSFRSTISSPSKTALALKHRTPHVQEAATVPVQVSNNATTIPWLTQHMQKTHILCSLQDTKVARKNDDELHNTVLSVQKTKLFTLRESHVGRADSEGLMTHVIHVVLVRAAPPSPLSVSPPTRNRKPETKNGNAGIPPAVFGTPSW